MLPTKNRKKTPELPSCREHHHLFRPSEFDVQRGNTCLAEKLGSKVLAAWAYQVKNTIKLQEELSVVDWRWRLIGPSIVIHMEYPIGGAKLAEDIASEAGLELMIVASNEIDVLATKPNALRTNTPLLIYIEPGEWQTASDQSDEDAIKQARKGVQALLNAFDPAHPVLCMTAIGLENHLPDSLTRESLFDRSFRVAPTPIEAVGSFFIRQVGAHRCGPSLLQSSAKVGALVQKDFGAPEDQKLLVLRLMRLHADISRPLDFVDLVKICSQGLAEGDNETMENCEIRERVAWHEAGHAAIAVLDSNGEDIPDFISILPHGNTYGSVVTSIAYSYAGNERCTFEDVRHCIRVSLGGRAAEELIFGKTKISAGAALDLENCTSLAGSAFAKWGFSPDMEFDRPSGGNLALVLGKPTASEYAHVEEMVRGFLSRQYSEVLKILNDNQSLLAEIASELVERAVLDQIDMSALLHSHSTRSP